MRRFLKFFLAAASVALLSLTPLGGVAGMSLESSANGVTVQVKPRAVSDSGTLEVEITLTSHTQDLTDDLMQTSLLVAGSNEPQRPTKWQGDPPGGHHRKGVLSFAVPARSDAYELRLQRLGEVAPRLFRWQQT